MGLTQSTHPSPSNLPTKSQIHLQQQNWLLLQKPEVNVTQMGSFVILKNKLTDEVARSYTLHFSNKKQFDIYVEEFDQWRSLSHWNVIESKYLVSDKESFGLVNFCSNFFQVKIFVENPVLYLSEIKDVPSPQSFYILLSALVGFQHLFQVFGYFPLCQNMITINQFGLVKVWINTDLSKNRPNYFISNHMSVEHTQNPTRFIMQLIELIDNNKDYSGLQQSFRQFIHTRYDQKSVLTFGKCRKFLLTFAEENNIDIPDSLMSILDLLFEKTNRSCISQQNNLIQKENTRNVLYGKNYVAGGYLLDEEINQAVQDDMRQYNKFSSGQNSNPYQFNHQSHNELIQSFQQYPQSNQAINQQVHQIIQMTTSQHNQTSSQSSNHLSSRQMSYNTLADNKNMIGFQSQSQSPPSHYEGHGHYHQHSHGVIYTESYQNSQERPPKLPIINFIHNNNLSYDENPYHSLVQRQILELQSTIREQVQEDSFMTSNKNSKFHTSRDLRRTSNQLKKTYKNMQTHRHTFSSHSQSKLNIQNYSPRQVYVRQEPLTQRSSNPVENETTKRSGKSIQFFTPKEIKQIDEQIAKDLEYLMASLGHANTSA